MHNLFNQTSQSQAENLGVGNTLGVNELCDHLRQWCGVLLEPTKTYLIKNRLRALMQEFAAKDYHCLVALANEPGGLPLRSRIVDALTTHETLFFRDASPFEAIAQHIVPERLKENPSRPSLHVWTAACSSGQEPYSVAITLLESISNLASWNTSILGTDVSMQTIEAAKEGVYKQHEVRRGLDPERLNKYFAQEGDSWRVKSTLRSKVRFGVSDLRGASQPPGPFDIIFCRNVLIYFSADDAVRILRRITASLSANGRLFLGCSEVPRGVDGLLMKETLGRSTCFRRVPSE